MTAVLPEIHTKGGGEGVPIGMDRLARGLGWFSIGLGVAEVAAPRRVARVIGLSDTSINRNLLVGLGLREIASGVAILNKPEAPGRLWARVGGDVMDLVVLGSRFGKANRNRVAAATVAVVGVMALDIFAGRGISRGSGTAVRGAQRGIHARETITINQPPEVVYRFWHEFENLPRFMHHLESVEVLDEQRSRWTAKAPAGTTVQWEAEIVDDRPNALIAWRSLEGAEVDNVGSVRFLPAPSGKGTEIHVDVRYDPPAGALGAAIAKLFGEEPRLQIAGDLRRLKQVVETGEIVHSDASIHRGPHPARPSAAPM